MMKFVIVPAMALALAGCNDKPSADRVQREQQEGLAQQARVFLGGRRTRHPRHSSHGPE